MKSSKKPWPLSSIFGIRSRIDTNPDFQRPPVWSKSQKQLLIDTILRGYDVPKLYWQQTGSKPDTYAVVDGQQRLRCIWEFMESGFRLPKNADPVDDMDTANCSYQDLPDDLRIRFDTYSLDVVILEDTDEDEVREMFLRLQNGTSLKAQEKRNAYPGRMRDFVKDVSGHPFFQSVGFANSRFNHDLVAAQIICMELAGGPTNIRNADLNKMYDEQKDFDKKNSSEARAVNRTLNFLREVFPEKTPELERYNVISLYCVFAELLNQFSIESIKPQLHDWFVEFEQVRRDQDTRPEDEADPEWISYKEKISHSTDTSDSIKWRMEFLLRHLLERFPDLPRKDKQRDFTHVQKLAIFRRDGGICQVRLACDGVKVTWDNWHADHIKAWSMGGPTTVANGQVSCIVCNLKKGNREFMPAPTSDSITIPSQD